MERREKYIKIINYRFCWERTHSESTASSLHDFIISTKSTKCTENLHGTKDLHETCQSAKNHSKRRENSISLQNYPYPYVAQKKCQSCTKPLSNAEPKETNALYKNTTFILEKNPQVPRCAHLFQPSIATGQRRFRNRGRFLGSITRYKLATGWT